MRSMRRHWPLLLLTVGLVAWEPVTFALYAAGVVDRVVDRGVLATTVLIAGVIVTAIGIAAGLSLWNERPWAIGFARVAVGLSAATTLVNALTSALPHNAPPGLAAPMLAASLAWDGAWVIYLTRLLHRA